MLGTSSAWVAPMFAANPSPTSDTVTTARAAALLSRVPLSFEGTATAGRFVARSLDYGVLLDGGDATVASPGGDIRLSLAGRNPQPTIRPTQPSMSTTNYLLGNDPARWRTGVTSFGTVAFESVWPGIDAVWHGRRHHLEVDFVVAPGADPDTVAIDLGGAGADGLVIDAHGALVIGSGAHQTRLESPTLYQQGPHGRRELVDGGFVVRSAGQFGFRVGPHDPTRPLVIDPVLVSSTYLGGSSSDSAFSVAVDNAGNVYLTGSTESSDFPTAASVQPNLVDANSVRTDAFVTKLNAAGTALVYSTYLGGKGHDIGFGIVVGADGSPYVAGSTDSADFPLSKPLKTTFAGGASDAFLTKLTPQGAAIDYSTYLGGGGADIARGLALDTAGDAIVAGSTSSGDFPTVKAFQPTLKKADDTDGFVAKVSPSGGELLYSTFLGGSGPDHATAVAVDGSGAAYVTGDTRSSDFPTVNAFQTVANGAPGLAETATDAFVTKLDPNGGALVYSTYLGGGDSDQAAGIAVDRDGSAYVTGNTSSTNFPVVRAVQEKKNGDTDAFASRLSSAGSTLIFSTYLGGSASDGGTGITVDRLGRASFVGGTASTDFPLAKPFQATKAGGQTEAFVSTLAADGSSLAFSSYLGGRDEDLASSITTDHDGNLYVAGYTNSADFPTARPFQPAKGGGVGDAFVAKIGDQVAKATASVSPPSPARERRIQIFLTVTIVIFGAAIAQTVWLRRRSIPTGPRPEGLRGRPVPESAFGGMAVGRIEGERYEPPPGVRRVAPVPPPDVDDEEGEPPLPLVAPVRPLRSRHAVPSPPPPAPSASAPELLPNEEVPADTGADADLEPTSAVPVTDLVPEDPALSEAWAESPVPDDLWAPPDPEGIPVEAPAPPPPAPPPAAAAASEPLRDIAVPDLIPDPPLPGYGDDDAEMWQMMTVNPDGPGLGDDTDATAPSHQSISELLAEDLPFQKLQPPLDDDLSIAELLDDSPGPEQPPDKEQEPDDKG